MATPASQHPFLDVFASVFAPMHGAPGHENDPPPVERLLPPGFDPPDLLGLIGLFIAADHDLRTDRVKAATANLDLAETRLRLAMSHGEQAKPAYEAVLGDIVLARDAARQKDSARALAAVADAVRALAAVPTGR